MALDIGAPLLVEEVEAHSVSPTVSLPYVQPPLSPDSNSSSGFCDSPFSRSTKGGLPGLPCESDESQDTEPMPQRNDGHVSTFPQAFLSAMDNTP